MARPLRIEFEDALYHVTSRGNHRERIFVDDTDRRVLLATIGKAMERFDARVFAYCLMDNHYHLVLQTHRGNLSRLMRHVNGGYAQTYNHRHGKIGHLFQGRFHAILVQRDAYFLQVCRYVDLNPVRADVVSQPHEWRWSSYRAHAARAAGPRWLDSAEVYRVLAPQAVFNVAAAAYARFVAEGRGVKLWENAVLGQIYLGDAAFVHCMQEKLGNLRDAAEIPHVQREWPSRPLQHYLEAADRSAAIARAHLEGRYTQAAIARATASSRSSVSRLIARYRASKEA